VELVAWRCLVTEWVGSLHKYCCSKQEIQHAGQDIFQCLFFQNDGAKVNVGLSCPQIKQSEPLKKAREVHERRREVKRLVLRPSTKKRNVAQKINNRFGSTDCKYC